MEYEQEDNPKNQFPLDPSSYKITDEIAVGVGVVVYKAVCVPMDSAGVAIKVIDRDQCTGVFEIYQREALTNETMPLLSHPNILGAHCSFTVDHHLWVVMPYMSCGSLHSIISSSFQGGLPEECVALVLKETLKALSYLHKGGHIHGDVKPTNILLDSKGCVKLGDFGASFSFYRRKSTLLYWVAPEIIKSQAVWSFQTDIWSLGMTALVTSRSFSEALQDMITLCLHKDPAKRPSADELLKLPFFEGCKATSKFLVEHFLRLLPCVEERFRESKILLDPHGHGASSASKPLMPVLVVSNEDKSALHPAEDDEDKSVLHPAEDDEDKPVLHPAEDDEDKPVLHPAEDDEDKPVLHPAEDDEDKPVLHPAENADPDSAGTMGNQLMALKMSSDDQVTDEQSSSEGLGLEKKL